MFSDHAGRVVGIQEVEYSSGGGCFGILLFIILLLPVLFVLGFCSAMLVSVFHLFWVALPWSGALLMMAFKWSKRWLLMPATFPAVLWMVIIIANLIHFEVHADVTLFHDIIAVIAAFFATRLVNRKIVRHWHKR